jgi:hypothetical protein
MSSASVPLAAHHSFTAFEIISGPCPPAGASAQQRHRSGARLRTILEHKDDCTNRGQRDDHYRNKPIGFFVALIGRGIRHAVLMPALGAAVRAKPLELSIAPLAVSHEQ